MLSYIDMSMYFPRPVRVRSYRASMTAYAAFMPETMSPRATPSHVGGPSACPLVFISPLIAWATMSYAGRLLYGPRYPSRLPKPEMHTYTSPGFFSDRAL